MNPIQPPLKLGDTGPKAANLQSALQFFYARSVFKTFDPPNSPTASDLEVLIQALARESQQQDYGKATQALIKHFQIQQGLGDNLYGVVEERTAKRINELLLELGGPIETTYVVTGTITNDKTHSELSNLVVCALDAGGATRTALGKSRSYAKGHYRIDFESSAFQKTNSERVGPDLIIEVFDKSGEVKFGQSKRYNNCATATIIDVAIDVPTHCVYGTVTNSTKQPQAKIIVTAWDRDLRKRQLLGTAITDEKGYYVIAYPSYQFEAADVPNRKTPWLIIETQYDKNDKIEKSVELKPAQVKNIQRVDFELDVMQTDSLTEFEDVNRLATPLLIGQDDNETNLSPSALNTNDIQFIATETGFAITLIQSWSAAHSMQQAAIQLLAADYPAETEIITKLGWPLFYGLCSQLNTLTLQGLYSCTVSVLTSCIESAQRQRQIPTVSQQDTGAFCKTIELLGQLQQLQVDVVDKHPIAQVTSLLDIPLSTKIKLAALRVVEQVGSKKPDALLSLHKDFPNQGPEISRFIQGMRLHQLAKGDAALIGALDNHVSNDGDSIASLAGLAVSDWSNLATQSNVSAPVVMAMLNTMELTHPVEALQARLTSQKMTGLSGEITQGIERLLRDDPEKVRDLAQGRTPVLNTNEDVAEKTLNSLGLFGRLGLPYEVGSVLIAANIDTPSLVVEEGIEAIGDLIYGSYGEVAKHLGGKAIKSIEDAKAIGRGFIQESLKYQNIRPGWYIKPDKPGPEVRENLPNIPALFGDLDECICAPCESMLGQPAYLVDLLQLLSKKNAKNQKPIDFLRSRRQDIFLDLKLGCEQVDSEFLHIDLAIEVMQRAAIRRFYHPNIDIALPRLYAHLANQPYPWFLPFDQQLATRTAYLSKLGIDRRQLDELTQQQYDDNQIAASILGIPYSISGNPGSVEWTLLTQESRGTALWKLYGFTPDAQGNISVVDPASNDVLNNQPASQVIRRISVLLNRVGLGLDDFEKLIQQPYIGNLSIDNRTQCKTSDMKLNIGSQALEGCLDLIHRMVRLQRYLNWTYTDINRALTMSQQGTSLNDIIVQIAHIKALADTYHLPVNFLCGLPQSYETILRTLAVTRAQRLCLEKILGIDSAHSPISLTSLKAVLTFNTLFDGLTLSTEELGLTLLPHSDLQSIFPILPKHAKSETEIAASVDRLINALKIEQRLQQGAQQTLPPLDDESIVTLVATTLASSEQDAGRYVRFKIPLNRTLIQLFRTPNSITSNDMGTIKSWLNCAVRLDGIRSKFDSHMFYALLDTFDWIAVIATGSTTAISLTQSLVNWLWLATSERMGPQAISEILKISASNDSTKFTDVIDIFAKRFEMAKPRIISLAALVGLSQNSFNGFNNAALVKRLFALLSFARQWQADSAAITNLSGNNLSVTVESLLRARHDYTDNEWTEVQRSIENPIRQQKRNALVAELIHLNPQFQNANDIYEHYLIDPLVEPCMKTTRVLEAVTATQLFAQRVLFGVEKYRDSSNVEHTLTASQALQDQWTWMRNYRVWEANRKVFLFPENWLYPELRDDKSSSFELLESALGKGELNSDLANDAFGQFLDSVAEMAQVEVLSMYEDIARDTAGKLTKRDLYIIGRSLNLPYTYFWKQCIDFGGDLMEWTGWKRIELEIEGDHIIPFILNGKLNISWLSMSKVTDSSGFLQTIKLKIVRSKHRMGVWEKPTASRDSITILPAPFRDDRKGYALRVRADANGKFDRATVSCYVATSALQLTAPSQAYSSVNSELTALPMQRPTNSTVSVHVVDPDSHPESHPTLHYWPPEFGTPERSALRHLTWECWLKLKAGAGFGWMRLNSFNMAEHRIEIRSSDSGVSKVGISSDHTWIDLGDGSLAAAHRLIGAYSRVEESTWKAYAEFYTPLEVISLEATPIKCERVDTGRSREDHLIFNIDASRYTAEDLGLSYEGLITFKKLAQFIIDDTSEFIVESGNNRRLFAPPNTTPFMNGYLENMDASNTHSLFLEFFHADGAFGGTEVFPSSKQQRYFAIEANSNRGLWESASIWHFTETNGSTFIDFAPRRDPARSEFRLLPHSFEESRATSISWGYGNQFATGSGQAALFGADKLPTVGPLLLHDTLKITPNNTLDVQEQAKLTFDKRLPYSSYEWEIFFHAPLLIADQLSKQHQFEDAEQWLRYVFDPTSTEPGANATRILKFQVFKELDTDTRVVEDLKAIAQAASGYYTDADVSRINGIIARWRQLPFRPFVIARGRHIAFLWRTLFAYIDNLISWADSLYRRDTRESNNEALMLYVLAYRILGRRPKQMLGTSRKVALTYDQLAAKLDDFSNYWVDVATRGDGYQLITQGRSVELINKQPPTSFGALLFCMPHNDKLDQYWNVIEERLFNLRHCKNIEGVTRDLAFLDPPIDPELLIRATAAGLDLNSVVAGLYAAPPHYRYGVLAARALELASETKSLGAAMLSAMEKRDAEQLSHLRSTNELSLLQQVGESKKLQIKEAEANITALRASRKSSEARFSQYQRLLGLESAAPDEGASAGEVAMLGQLDKGNSSPRSGLGLITEEGQQYKGFEGANTWSTAATIAKTVGGAFQLAASVVAGTPAGISPTTGVPTVAVKIPEAIGTGASLIGDSFSFVSQGWRMYAEQQGMLAGHLRRRDEWAFQSNQIIKELKQIDKQILANQIRIDITKKELDNHQLQIEQSKAVDEVMRSKFTNVQLYDWMSKELYGLYNYAYRMALEMGRKAQRAAERELGLKAMTLDKIRNGHWNSMKQGLLAGEKLHHDLKRLDESYMDMNKREFELTKHISLRRLDPVALANLRITRTVDGERVNQCSIEIPEWLFDLDTPGHYLRRIKSVAISIPCVAGPYSSVNSALTLLKSSIRYEKDPTIALHDTLGATEAVVTSSASADSGMFETQLRDERFLPFEGRGVISIWRLELPAAYKQFEYSTISDVILTLRYTARDGGDQLKKKAIEAISAVSATTPRNFSLLISCRSDLASDWMRAKAEGTGLSVRFSNELLPYWMRNATPVSAKKMVLVTDTDAESRFESITWNRLDPIAISEVSSFEDILLIFEVQLL